VIETERLILRPLTLDDAKDVAEYQSREEAVRFVPFSVRDEAAVIEAINRQTSKVPLVETGDFMILGAQLKSTGQVIAGFNLGLDNKADRVGNFGYMVNPDFWGKGFAYEGSVGLLDYAFAQENMHRLIAQIDYRNTASIRLAEKLGMRREATFIEHERLKGEWVTDHIYAILAREWLSKK
jgi:RimJ/RimL family protein N-acetyltransferase